LHKKNSFTEGKPITPTRAHPVQHARYPRREQGSTFPQKISPRTPTQHNVEGTIRITSKGVGYVEIEGMKEDIEIDPAFLNTALHNDRVEITLHSKIVGIRQGGEVIKILNREKTSFVGGA
jgi:exoribonuclease R